VGPRAGLDDMEKRKILTLPGPYSGYINSVKKDRNKIMNGDYVRICIHTVGWFVKKQFSIQFQWTDENY
jgi:hypothetical protein